MMKKTTLLLISILAGTLFSCNSEDEWLNSFQTLDDEQYAFYVAEALGAMNMPRPEGSYNYPCLPGMLSWNELKSSNERTRVGRVRINPGCYSSHVGTSNIFHAHWF